MAERTAEPALLKEDEVDALRINPFFKRSGSSKSESASETEDRKAVKPTQVSKPSKVQDLKVSKFIVGPSEEECYSTDHPKRYKYPH